MQVDGTFEVLLPRELEPLDRSHPRTADTPGSGMGTKVPGMAQTDEEFAAWQTRMDERQEAFQARLEEFDERMVAILRRSEQIDQRLSERVDLLSGHVSHVVQTLVEHQGDPGRRQGC